MVPTALLTDACAQVRAGDLKEGMGRLLALRADHVENREAFDHPDLATLLTTLVECRLARGELAEAMVLGDELAPYLAGKGTIRFPADQPLPLSTVSKVVKIRLAENAARQGR